MDYTNVRKAFEGLTESERLIKANKFIRDATERGIPVGHCVAYLQDQESCPTPKSVTPHILTWMNKSNISPLKCGGVGIYDTSESDGESGTTTTSVKITQATWNVSFELKPYDETTMTTDNFKSHRLRRAVPQRHYGHPSIA